MVECGFDPYDCEWWHYSLRDEPYPNTYFDFPIRTTRALLDV
jgi:D-alanyl-D-alanine dipeptidase